MIVLVRRILLEDDAQDIAEYAVILAVILVLVVGTIPAHCLQRQQRVLCRS